MFPRRKRLSRAAFPNVLAGKRLSSTHFSAVFSHNAVGYAVVVPKKVAKLSVTRHKIKRRILEALRTLSVPSSLILFPKTTVSQMTYQDVQTELATLLSKIRQ